MKIHLVLDCLDYGDGVSNDVIAQREMLRELGFESDIYTSIFEEKMKNARRDIKELSCEDDDIIIHHYSNYSEIIPCIKNQSCRKILLYHNITPPDFLEGESREACLNGLDQLTKIEPLYDYYAGDSQFNLDCLCALGISKAKKGDVLPIPVEFSVKSDNFREPHKRGLSFLFVGRLAPNKKIEDIIRIFSYYHKNIDSDATLHIVGNPYIMENYTNFLHSIAKETGCENSIWFDGKVSDEELQHIYSKSDLYLSMSEHEGFCIPLLEAMWHRLPVFAYDAGAVSETMGRAGVVLKDKNPAVVSEAISAVFKDPDMIQFIIDSQNKRILDFSREKIKEKLGHLMDKWNGSIKEDYKESEKSHKKKLKIQMQGPFETSYSLAQVNRNLIEAMFKLEVADVSIHCTEGPGDYTPKEQDLIDKPLARFLWKREHSFGVPDVAIRNMFPPVTTGLTAQLNFQLFGWEEDRVPSEYVEWFNRDLDGIGTMSDFVTDSLLKSGVKIPVKTIGNGVRLPDDYDELEPYEVKTRKRIRFLHISSAFPRKGVDVLLETYFRVFSNSDDVCLILKTFPNIHNKTQEQLKKLKKQYPDGPEVEHIDQDLPESELYRLYKAASCYVHCARGEGFGLPVAEAMLAGVPTIVCNNSGLADFCNEKTCLTVGFKSVKAHSHLTENSNWYEPDATELGKQMRRFVDNPQDLGIEDKVNAARELIATKFTWEAAARRWMDFIEEVQRDKRKPQVDMITTWNNKCGIAEYSRYFVEHSNMLVDYKIFPDTGHTLLRLDEEFVQKRVWKQSQENDHVIPLIELLLQSSSETVFVQYNLGFFSVKALSELCLKMQGRKKVIVLFHATKEIPNRISEKDKQSVANGLNSAFRLVVHQPKDIEPLVKAGVRPEVISVIPHGQMVFPNRNIKEARNIMNMKSDHVVGSFGFILPHKGIEKTIEAISILKNKYPDIIYIASCAVYDADISKKYYAKCCDTIRRLGLEDNVLMFPDFLDTKESIILLQSCDLMVMPYDVTNESASGAIRFCVAAQRPLITTKQDIFKEFEECSYQIEGNEPQQIADAIDFMFREENSSKYSKKMKEQIQRTCWNTVVNMYCELF